jgi:NAD(P)-dependent dehydrogenase (short-subunit alcohol dehydrogenase family)
MIYRRVQQLKTRFGFSTTADEVAASIDLTSKRAIVTGATSGIGIETARALARAGAAVTLAARNLVTAEAVVQDIRSTTGNAMVSVAELDTADQNSVRAFVSSCVGPLHILVNNAGVMAKPDCVRTLVHGCYLS